MSSLNDINRAPINRRKINQDIVESSLSTAIELFKKYLIIQKDNGKTYLNFSQTSQTIIDNWGTTIQSSSSVVHPESSFNFEGSQTANLFIIDSHSSFFKNDSGELLINILKAMNLAPDSVFICNAVNLKSINLIVEN